MSEIFKGDGMKRLWRVIKNDPVQGIVSYLIFTPLFGMGLGVGNLVMGFIFTTIFFMIAVHIE